MAFSGSPGPVMRQKAKGTRPKRNAERRAARRAVMAGFPIEPTPFTLADIRSYFGGDRITCLLCGKTYKRIGAGHLHRIHSMTEDEYRLRYGLPWRRGLTSNTSHNIYSEVVLQRLEENGNHLLNPEWRGLAHATPSRRPVPPYRIELNRINCKLMNERRLAKGEQHGQA